MARFPVGGLASQGCLIRPKAFYLELTRPFNTIGAGHEVDTVASHADRAGDVASSMACHGYRVDRLYRWMDRYRFYTDEIRINGASLS